MTPGRVEVITAVALLLSIACTSTQGGDSDLDSSGGSAFEAAVSDMASCMRDRGVDLRDARFDAGGEVVRWVDITGTIDVAAIRAAVDACSDRVPQVVVEQPAGDPRIEAALVDFVECMREEGIDNMPDPVPQGIDLRGSGIDPRAPAFRAAEKTCKHLLEVLE